jgi:tetratricopeptide (TPR) repeat protein
MNMENLPDWYLSNIEQFVNAGFFDGEDDKETIAQRIIQESEQSYFGSILDLQDDPLFEQVLVSYDRKKVWFIEDYLDYGSPEDYSFYKDVFVCLSTISTGIFQPEHIKIEECGFCDARDKRLSVSFQLNENVFNVNFCADLQVLKLNFLEEINEILPSQGYSFEYIFDSYGAGFIFFLTHSQKQYLSLERKWEFDEHAGSGYWLDRALYCRNIQDNLSAEKYFQKAIQDLTNNINASTEFGFFLAQQGKQDRAIEIYEKGIKHLNSLESLDERQKWYLSFIEDSLMELQKRY